MKMYLVDWLDCFRKVVFHVVDIKRVDDKATPHKAVVLYL